jgi:hypothetical protein
MRKSAAKSSSKPDSDRSFTFFLLSDHLLAVVLDVANVIWCTGFRPGFSWIHLPAFGEDGVPQHESGVAAGEPGLYFVGLPFIFIYAFSSAMIYGVGKDAEHIFHRAPHICCHIRVHRGRGENYRKPQFYCRSLGGLKPSPLGDGFSKRAGYYAEG